MSQTISQDFNPLTLLKFAFPSIVMMVFMSCYTIVDGVFISRFAGSNALSAVNIVYPMYSILMAFGTMISTGGSAVVAKQMGEGKKELACKNFSFLVISGLLISIILTLFTEAFLTPLSLLLGSSELILADCKAYLGWLYLFGPFCMLQAIFQAFFIAAGKPGLGMGLTIFAGIVNAVLDYVFIAIFGLGVTGAALATGLGQAIPAIFGVIFFFSKRGDLNFTKFKPNKKVFLQTCFNGSSEMVTNLSSAVITYAFNIILMRLAGEDGVAAITILLYAQFLFVSLFLGFSMGVAPIFSYQYGAGNKKQLHKIYRICNYFTFISSLLITLLAFIFAKPVVSVFVSQGSAAYTMANDGFIIFSFCFLFSGFNIFSSSLFTALSDGKTSAIISFSRTFLFILMFLLILPEFLGLTGVWLAIPLAEFATVFLCFFFHLKKLLPSFN